MTSGQVTGSGVRGPGTWVNVRRPRWSRKLRQAARSVRYRSTRVRYLACVTVRQTAAL
jgi:hypothetical protein